MDPSSTADTHPWFSWAMVISPISPPSDTLEAQTPVWPPFLETGALRGLFYFSFPGGIASPCQSHLLSMPCPSPLSCSVELSLSFLQVYIEACLWLWAVLPWKPLLLPLSPSPTCYTCFWLLRLGNQNIGSVNSVCPLTKSAQHIPETGSLSWGKLWSFET